MSKIRNDGLTRSGTGCFIAVPIMATVGVQRLTVELLLLYYCSFLPLTSVKCLFCLSEMWMSGVG